MVTPKQSFPLLNEEGMKEWWCPLQVALQEIRHRKREMEQGRTAQPPGEITSHQFKDPADPEANL